MLGGAQDGFVRGLARRTPPARHLYCGCIQHHPSRQGGFGGSGGLPSSRSTPADLFAMGLRDGEQHSSHNSSRAEARRQALLKARFTRPEGLVDVLWVFILATVVKVLLIPSYRSTDFEVHRNWLALTHSLPMHEWYFESTSEWTLDYPPLFAYFEYGLSHVARFFDPAMLVVSNLNYASSMTVVFQRLSVIASDFVLMVGIIMWSKTWSRTRVTECAHSRGKFAIIAGLTFLNPGLLMVDHIHFQYNGMLLGLLLISLSLVRMEKNLRALCTFCALLLAKHIFFYVVPVFGVYLLGHYCWTVPSFVTSKQLRRCRRREKAEEDVKKKETGGEAQGYATSEDDDEREDEDDDSNMGGGSSSGPVHKTWDTTSRELRQRRRAEGFLSGSDGKRKELNVDKNEEKQENDEIDENDEDASPGLCCACCGTVCSTNQLHPTPPHLPESNFTPLADAYIPYNISHFPLLSLSHATQGANTAKGQDRPECVSIPIISFAPTLCADMTNSTECPGKHTGSGSIGWSQSFCNLNLSPPNPITHNHTQP